MKKLIFILLLTFIALLSYGQYKSTVKLADSSVVQKTINVNYAGKFTDDATGPFLYHVYDAALSVYVEGETMDVGGFQWVTAYVSKTASTADNLYLKVIGLTGSAETVDYQQTNQATASGGVTTVDANVYEFDKGAINQYISIPTGGLKWMRLDCAKTAEAGTASTVTIHINKKP